MKSYIFTSLMMVILISSTVGGQAATIWGPGEDYEIDFLHSGEYRLNDSSKISFENEPSTEFTLSNITNEGYDYIYLGYNGLSDMGSITMDTISLGGIATITIPSGGMPVVLPLSYEDEEEWMVSFSEKLNEISAIAKAQDFERFNINSSTDDELLYLKFDVKANSSVSTPDAFIDLPQLQLPEFEGKNNTYVNTTLTGTLSYQLSTGVLFELNVTLTADQLLVENENQGRIFNSQALEFVAIIPPASIIDELRFEMVFGLFVIAYIPLRKHLRSLVSRKKS